MNSDPAGGDDRREVFYRPRFFGWKPYMRRTGSLAGRFHSPKYRQDTCVHTVQPKLEIFTFWLDENIGGGGTGPCLSLYCHGFEVLRFDCFGKNLGHFHIAPFTPWHARARRFWFHEQTAQAQIDRALFELSRNVQSYLCLNPRRRVRRMRVDSEAMASACAQARKTLISYLEVDALRGLKTVAP